MFCINSINKLRTSMDMIVDIQITRFLTYSVTAVSFSYLASYMWHI